MQVNKWLRDYVYSRLLSNQPEAKPSFYHNFLTLMVSSLWHGLRPKFFAFFLVIAFFIETSKKAYRV
jgi:D-alanyl-lipoteichoic acid acyltransferase DltB (MBOAT superfamily)